MSGTGHTTTYNTASGDNRIDGLLTDYHWGDATITYSFPTTNIYPASYGADEDDGFFALTATMIEVASFALDADYGNAANDGFSIEGFTNVTIEDDTSATTHIRIAQTTDDPYNYDTAWAYYPSTSATGGDIWLTDQVYNYSNPEVGTYAYLTMIHEIGHAMGLSHSHESSSYGTVPSQYDAMEYTVMSYKSYAGATNGYKNETYGYAQSYMMQDIAALQHMYGADFTTNSGNTVYSWDPTSGDTMVNGVAGIDAVGNRIFATIWDGGGVDTYDLSAYATDLEIDLAPGSSSLFSSTQQATLGFTGQTAQGNIYNALQYQGDARSLIENAIGGSGNDTILGNEANNKLEGGDGNNRLVGLDGDDILLGGTGRDVIMSGKGNDISFGDVGNDFLRGGNQSDIIGGGDGNDKLYGDAGGDDLYGGEDNDTLYGGTGMDELYGNSGNDILYGEDGRDFIKGGTGFDIMYGGNQRDVFIFADVLDSPTGSPSDRIMDFTIAYDDIDLSALTAAPMTLAIGGGFSGTGASVITNEVGSDTLIFIDLDGDASADMRIVLEGTLGVTAGDFLL